MTIKANSHVSFWQAEPVPRFEKLHQNLATDVCVIGAGVAGLTTAYELLRAGLRKVTVLEDGVIASGETSRTTAHISNALDDRYTELERLHGFKGAQLAAESHTWAIRRMKEICDHEQISCDYEVVDGFLFATNPEEAEDLKSEYAAAKRAGIEDVELCSSAPGIPFAMDHCLRFPQQAQLHPEKYIAGLAKAVKSLGGKIFTSTHVQKIESSAKPVAITKEGFKVTSKNLVIATNSSVFPRIGLNLKQSAYRSYVVGLRVPAGSLPNCLLWDCKDPYHYVRIAKNQRDSEDILLVGGEDHRTGQNFNPDECFTRLEQWARERFPMALETAYLWSGQILEPCDGLAFIGRDPHHVNIYHATGDSGHGMTHATIAANILTDLIQDKTNKWSKLYDPGRISLKSLATFASENFNTALQYKDWFIPAEVDSEQALEPGKGALLRHGVSKIACYRDLEGNLHKMSATCPHLGGVVAWNQTEKTWDCPCHGSRFDCEGNVINGPAIENLKPL